MISLKKEMALKLSEDIIPKPYKVVDWDQMILDKRDARNTKIKLAAEKNRKKQLLENKNNNDTNRKKSKTQGIRN